MKLCYNVQTCSKTSDLEQDITLSAASGFSHIEINIEKAEHYLKTHRDEELYALLQKHSIECASINAVFDISFASGQKWDNLRATFDRACELARIAHTTMIIVLSSERVDLPQDISDSAIFDDTVSVLKKLSNLASKRGISIGFEPVGTMAVGDLFTAWQIMQQVDEDNVGLVVDAFNLYLWDLEAAFDPILHINPKKISIVHLNDAESIPFARLDQMHRCMPGDGRIQLKYYIQLLKTIGYEGLVSVEVLNPRIWEKGPHVVIPEAYQKANTFL
ncbi:sugar phosphate isomerase/epimerase family protein [Sphaerochaeta sp.]|jgi:2-keto-myo-inositol isomerase|uniref:sugar phosphate isomerase/epimerase family protein n=1 Tax=Sphaerochaeta sp. TaxID=1972642 RepID=UPI002A35C859|nr:sugar phosphate isomerase/epimerase family protein [Sphaerochaeta sp.]MDX9984561.1 sugar phosphate isomerase/epimerase family protein [Sphaerochaeta sp.]NCB25543.1 sugar phosphate isomerase/epimerase [Bacteroidia bacterium]